MTVNNPPKFLDRFLNPNKLPKKCCTPDITKKCTCCNDAHTKNRFKNKTTIQSADQKHKVLNFINDSLSNIIYYSFKYQTEGKEEYFNKMLIIKKNLLQLLKYISLRCVEPKKMNKKVDMHLNKYRDSLFDLKKDLEGFKMACSISSLDDQQIMKISQDLYINGLGLCMIGSENGKYRIRGDKRKEITKKFKEILDDCYKKDLKVFIGNEKVLNSTDKFVTRIKRGEPLKNISKYGEQNDNRMFLPRKLLTVKDLSNSNQENISLQSYNFVYASLVVLSIFILLILRIKRNKRGRR